MPAPRSILSEGWDAIATFLAANADTLGSLAELVKIIGALASLPHSGSCGLSKSVICFEPPSRT
jgi:hypothetical protein